MYGCVQDFYEALVHVSAMKAMPTDEQLKEAGAKDAGVFLMALKEKPAEVSSLHKLRTPHLLPPVISGLTPSTPCPLRG